MIIEQLVKYYRKTICSSKLVWRHFKTRWKVMSILLVGLGATCLAVSFLTLIFLHLYWLTIILMLFGVIFMFLWHFDFRKKRFVVINSLYKVILGKIIDKGQLDSTIEEIQIALLNIRFPELTAEKAVFVIHALKDEQNRPRYSFKSSTIIVPIAAAFIAVFLTSIFKDGKLDDILHLGKVLLAYLIPITAIIVSLELLVSREIFHQSQNKNSGLIRLLENYILEDQDLTDEA